MLEREMITYKANQSQLLGQNRGKYVLIKDDKIIDVLSNIDDALKVGYEKFGNEAFLVKQVLEIEIPQNFTTFQIRV